MKLIGIVGGISNAFTSFDQTVYHDTIPSNHLEMALYLEADRMASFKVSEHIYATERKVVAEEWRIRQNRPYGTMYEDFLKNAFTRSHYRWTPIGNMDDLRAAQVGELQDFFNTYYLPNNAVLVVAGDIDVDATKALVHKYFAWIPKGPEVQRDSPQEPVQTEARSADVAYRVPLPAIMIGWRTPAYASDDHYALQLLGTILGGGQSSRLDRLLVNTDKPLAVQVGASDMQLEDAGVFLVNATVMQGKNPKQVEQTLTEAMADVLEHGVTQEELDKAKTLARVSLVHERETASTVASQLGDESLFAHDPDRVNQEWRKIDSVTIADIQSAAKKYLTPEKRTTLRVKPDPLGKEARAAATQAAMNTPVQPTTHPVAPRAVQFPADYPQHPPFSSAAETAKFEKGTETEIGGVKVIVMPDHRLPTVTWGLTMRNGSHLDPRGKEGLATLTDEMLRRGSEGLTFEQLNQDLESRGISLDVADLGDFTRVGGSAVTNQLEHGLQRTKQVLFEPTFPADEFAKLKEQRVNELAVALESPSTVSQYDLKAAVFGDSPLGVAPTAKSVESITLDDVKHFYASQYRRNGAILVIAGDVTLERGQQLARDLLDAWPKANVTDAPQGSNTAYRFPEVPGKRKIILVDRPGAKGAAVLMGIRAYDIHTEEKNAGSLAGQILTAGIDSRLNRYVRAEKGLSYGVHGVFQPGRHGGAFFAGTDCAVENVGESVVAMFKVFDDMRAADVTPDELAQAKTRVAGGMVMGMQTIQAQARMRVDAILNGYPIDYYDQYPQKIAAVSADQVRDVMQHYVDNARMTIVVVAPAETVKPQLEKLGDVEIRPMPNKRAGAPTTQPGELLK